MKEVDCLQGSAEWRKARMGIPTASRFGSILTAVHATLSAGSRLYRAELLAETFCGESEDDTKSAFMDRGSDMEDEARNWYSLKHDVDVRQVGFCLTDDRTCGCSPDGLIGDDGGLEIKCKGAKAQVLALLNDIPNAHRPQIQGALWVTGRKYWIRLYYHPHLTTSVVRIERDEPYIAKLSAAMGNFLERMAEERERLIAGGCKPVEIKSLGLRCRMKRPDGRHCLSGVDVVDHDGLLICAKCREVLDRGPLPVSERVAV